MPQTRQTRTNALGTVIRRCIRRALNPPTHLTLSQWADKYRRLSPESSAEAGRWHTSRTPYIKEPMDAFTDPQVRRIVIVAGSQVGKSEMQLNAIGYIIDQDPSSILYVHPTVEEAKKFSRLRVAPMIRDCPTLRKKVQEVKQGRDNAATILQKSFPGGILTMTGSNVPAALASMPIRYIIGDERDRWALTAGAEGDPWDLARARQTTFYNAKTIEVSTPTIKGASNIERSYNEGTMERWCSECPNCGEYHEITFGDIHFNPRKDEIDGVTVWAIDGEVEWCCPSCGALSSEVTMKQQPARWEAANPDAYTQKRTKSYWINGFTSPWESWSDIVLRFLESKDDPRRLQVVYNTLLGQLWEDRGDIQTEDVLMARREEYGKTKDGRQVDCPEGVLVLTMGVDTQDDRLEYEVVGHGLYGETWGIERGVINGNPSDALTWERLDGVIDRPYLFPDGRTIRVSAVAVDSQGHKTNEVYAYCRAHLNRGVIAIMGKGGETVPYTSPPTKRPINDDKRYTCWLYTLGVDAGKEAIMDALLVQEPGANYCHFPLHLSAGYDMRYFHGLLSEHKVQSMTSSQYRWKWEKIPGHERNEPLDCRNYALAVFRILKPDLFRLKREFLAGNAQKPAKKRRKTPKKRTKDLLGNDW